MGSKGCVFFLGTQARRQAESLGTIESGAQITVAGFCCMDSAGFFSTLVDIGISSREAARRSGGCLWY